MAYLGKGKLEHAEKELQAIQQITAKESLEDLTIWGINSFESIVNIAGLVLEGEILASKKKYEEAIKILTQATDLEDQLLYNEPPDWFLSTRHHLGAVLLEAEKYKEAESVFRKDLEEFPNNGWANYGLMLALEKSEKEIEAKKAKEEFDLSWKNADVTLSSSRIK
jgi:tetratricopeptide (TPR) repeat protein